MKFEINNVNNILKCKIHQNIFINFLISLRNVGENSFLYAEFQEFSEKIRDIFWRPFILKVTTKNILKKYARIVQI